MNTMDVNQRDVLQIPEKKRSFSTKVRDYFNNLLDFSEYDRNCKVVPKIK
jgi:hypothetical protein